LRRSKFNPSVLFILRPRLFFPDMRIRIFLTVAAVAASSLLIFAAVHPVCAAPVIKWTRIDEGLRFGQTEDMEYVRIGSPVSVILKIDPAYYRFEAFHYSAESLEGPLTIEEWREKVKAPVVFNAGQYFEGLDHMGLLVKNGSNIGTKLIGKWKGLFVQKEENGSEITRLYDLKYDHVDTTGQSYRFALQSLMLFDRRGEWRVRKSDLTANRTILATGSDGAVFLLCTEGGYTLWELAHFIQRLDVGIEQAMVLDGGLQSQLAVRTPAVSYVTYGKWSPQSTSMGLSVPGIHLKLPAVVALFPKKQKQEGENAKPVAKSE
jgi:uncharacterized protein YigE (DUF2233 family)